MFDTVTSMIAIKKVSHGDTQSYWFSCIRRYFLFTIDIDCGSQIIICEREFIDIRLYRNKNNGSIDFTLKEGNILYNSVRWPSLDRVVIILKSEVSIIKLTLFSLTILLRKWIKDWKYTASVVHKSGERPVSSIYLKKKGILSRRRVSPF